VLLEFIPVIGSEAQTLWGAPGGRGRRLLSRLQWRWLIVPPLRNSLLMAHCLTEWEVSRSARELGLPEDRFRFVPWFRSSDNQTEPSSVRTGVVASGRAACDWETVFAAARGQDWPLTVICSSTDLDRVSQLNKDGRARVLCEITPEQHAGEVGRCLVYLLALREAQVSSGQVRLAEAWDAGALVVASEIKGLEGYLDNGRNCITYEPGDPRSARGAIAALMDDEPLRSSLRETTSADIARWTRNDYLGTLRSYVDAAVGPDDSARKQPD
jgi:glycosyltransferase involved in cell wall biosynthesis